MRYIRSLRGGVIATSYRLVVSVVVKRTMSGGAVGWSNGRTGHVSVVAGAIVTGTGSEGSVAGGGGSGYSSDFRVTKLVVALLALPELGTGTLSVAVLRARTEALLLLVVTAKEDLYRDGDEEQETRCH